MVKGVKDIHKKGLVHCDLKNMNILVSGYDESGVPIVKITDFGQAVRLNQTEFFVPNSGGTVGYMAPEHIKREPCSAKIDVWSLGIILFSMLAATLPFLGDDQ